jgi:hypothetical protein
MRLVNGEVFGAIEYRNFKSCFLVAAVASFVRQRMIQEILQQELIS